MVSPVFPSSPTDLLCGPRAIVCERFTQKKLLRQRKERARQFAVLQEHIADESVDLIYLDPPLDEKRFYSLLFRSSKVGESITRFPPR